MQYTTEWVDLGENAFFPILLKEKTIHVSRSQFIGKKLMRMMGPRISNWRSQIRISNKPEGWELRVTVSF